MVIWLLYSSSVKVHMNVHGNLIIIYSKKWIHFIEVKPSTAVPSLWSPAETGAAIIANAAGLFLILYHSVDKSCLSLSLSVCLSFFFLDSSSWGCKHVLLFEQLCKNGHLHVELHCNAIGMFTSSRLQKGHTHDNWLQTKMPSKKRHKTRFLPCLYSVHAFFCSLEMFDCIYPIV